MFFDLLWILGCNGVIFIMRAINKESVRLGLKNLLTVSLTWTVICKLLIKNNLEI